MRIADPRRALRSFTRRHIRGLSLTASVAALTALVIARSGDPAMVTALGAGELLARGLLTSHWGS
jgi:hypothetical protein